MILALRKPITLPIKKITSLIETYATIGLLLRYSSSCTPEQNLGPGMEYRIRIGGTKYLIFIL